MTVQSYDRKYWKLLNEHNYVIQGELPRKTKRNLAIRLEEKVAIKRNVMNLRDEISYKVQLLRPTSFNEAQK